MPSYNFLERLFGTNLHLAVIWGVVISQRWQKASDLCCSNALKKIKCRCPQTSVFLLKVYCNFCILDGLVGLWLILGIPRINKPPRIKTPHPEAPQNPGKSLFKWKPFMKWSVVAGGTGGFINPSRLFGRVLFLIHGCFFSFHGGVGGLF